MVRWLQCFSNMKLLYNLEAEGVSNDRIEKHLTSLKPDNLRNDFCRLILDTKLHLIRLRNQCIQLKLRFGFDFNYSLRNLDLISLKSLKRAIEANLKSNKSETKAPKQKPIKFVKPKNKQNQKQSTQPRISTTPSVKLNPHKKNRTNAKRQKKKKPLTKLKRRKAKRKTPWAKIIYTPMYS